MNYYPNVEGVLWFGREVWPLIRARRPDARFLIVGASPSAAIRRLGRDPSIEVAGAVEAVQPYLWRSAVAVAPLRLARGLQNKVLEAIAAGLPVAAVPAVLDGLPPLVRQACVAADGARAFAAAVVDLLAMSPADRRGRAASGSIGQFEWSRQLSDLERLLRRAASPSSV
jgi:glycosyltransferase involved in cell wall biosynthesis